MNELKYNWSKGINYINRSCKRKEKNNANSGEQQGGIRLSRVWCLPSVFFWICLWLFISSSSRGESSNFSQHCIHHLDLPLEGASIAMVRVRPLGLSPEALFSFLKKLWVCSLASVPPILICHSLFPIMCSFWWTSCLYQGRGQSVEEDQLFPAWCWWQLCVWAEAGQGTDPPLLHQFLISLPCWPQWNRDLGTNVFCFF